jgi:hypothetical protein
LNISLSLSIAPSAPSLSLSRLTLLPLLLHRYLFNAPDEIQLHTKIFFPEYQIMVLWTFYALAQALLFGWLYGVALWVIEQRDIDIIGCLKLPPRHVEPGVKTVTTDGRFPFLWDGKSEEERRTHDSHRVFYLCSLLTAMLIIAFAIYTFVMYFVVLVRDKREREREREKR